MLGYWASRGRPIYSYMAKGQTIPYISDIAAQEIQPVFIVGSLISVVLLNLSLVFKSRHDRAYIKLLRSSEKHRIHQAWLSYLSIALTATGSIGLVLLARYDRLQYPGLHLAFLTLYVGAFSMCAAVASLACLRSCMRSGWRHQLLVAVLIIRLCTAILAATLGLAFWYAWKHPEIPIDFCPIIEWVLGICFAGHIACFAFDLLPLSLGFRKGVYMELV
ncbi:hypothetical protein FE257_008328 [Aspergillus nanangensis]|uniref:CWH43-like N-terminal domain-containing protein n=1 Tax=Aspergillus nanangensis TaxID=2582783 RepID=A0AAD4CN14_ASPNN|nr:hypothetical protein FE257_008328 [Aspergillus nanangensis]